MGLIMLFEKKKKVADKKRPAKENGSAVTVSATVPSFLESSLEGGGSSISSSIIRRRMKMRK